MRFELTDEQRGFGRALDDLLTSADTPAAVRAWAAGDPDLGLRVWKRLAEMGVCGLLVPEDQGGLGACPVDLVVAFEALGRHAVPGPWVESVAYLATLVQGVPDPGVRDELLGTLAEGAELATVAVPPHTPRALDADVATRAMVVADGSLYLGEVGSLVESVDPARRLFNVSRGRSLASAPDDDPGYDGASDRAYDRAYDMAALACSAQLLGLGEHLLTASVDYVKQRKQFGRAIGSYQAIKHALADVRIALDFVRPLVYGAALTCESRDVSAAKVAASDGSYLAARTALQVHGAIGYTAEHALSLWILKVRALVGAWGTPGAHRARILASLVEGA